MTAYDSAGENDGDVLGAELTESAFGGALRFDGVDDYVSVPTSDAFDFGTRDCSISLWFKTSGAVSANGEQYIIDLRENDNNPHVEIYTTHGDTHGRLGTHILPGNVRIKYNDPDVFDGAWHHVVVTLNNGVSNGYKLYLDGTIVGENTFSGILGGWDSIKIGGDDPHGPEFFHGLIDDVMVFDQSLSPEQVEELYRSWW